MRTGPPDDGFTLEPAAPRHSAHLVTQAQLASGLTIRGPLQPWTADPQPRALLHAIQKKEELTSTKKAFAFLNGVVADIEKD